MSRVTSILTKARRILSDQDSSRWTDADLLDVFNEGLQHFVLHTKSLKRRSYITIENNVAMYDLSDICSSIVRVQYLNEVLQAKTSDEMDLIDSTWEDTTDTEIAYVIFDTYENGIFRIYPKIESGMADVVTANSNYGGLIDIITTDDLFAVPSATIVEQDLNKYLLVFYIGKPGTVTINTIDADLDLHYIYDTAMVSYIVGNLLMADQDSISLNLSQTHLNMYESYVQKAISKEGKSNNTFTLYETQYRGIR